MADEELPTGKMGSDGKLLVEGDEHPYVQGMIRTLWLDVEHIKLHRGYSIDESNRTATAGSRISGTGRIVHRDTLAVAGLKNARTEKIPFSIRPVPKGDAKYDWRVNIGFLPYDWEIGHHEEFYFEAYCPQIAFDDLEAAYSTGKVTNIGVGCRTSLWVRDYDLHTPPSGDVTWYLVPEEKPSRFPRAETGTITSFGWTEIPPRQSKPMPEIVPDEEAPHENSGSEFARQTTENASRSLSSPRQSEFRKNVSTGLKWLVGLVAALVVLALFKH